MMLVCSSASHAQSLTDVVDQALSSYPTLAGAQAKTDAAKSDIARARSQHHPQIGISGSQNQYGTGTSSTTFTPTAKLNLWSGGRIEADAKRAEAVASSSEHGLLRTRDDVALMATEAYLNWSKAFDLHSLALANKTAHQAILDDIKKVSDVDTGRKIDYHQALVRMENANFALQQRQNELTQAATRVRKFWKAALTPRPQPLDEEFSDTGLLSMKGISNVDLTPAEMDRIPEIAQAKALVESAHFAVKQAKAQHWPTVDLIYSRVSANDVFNPSRMNSLTQVQVNMQVYNGGLVNAQVESAVAQLTAAKSQLDEVTLSVREKINLAWEEWNSTRSRISIGLLQTDVGGKVIEGYRSQYKGGRRSLLDLLNIQNEVFNYGTQSLSAYHEERIARARFLAARGELASRYLTSKNIGSQSK